MNALPSAPAATLRSFVKGDRGVVGALMERLYGSNDLFPDGPGDVYRPYQNSIA